MSSFRESRGALTPREFGVKRRYGLGKAMDGGKENLGPGIGGSFAKRPKLATPVRVRLGNLTQACCEKDELEALWKLIFFYSMKICSN